jgi:hypothetical protein
MASVKWLTCIQAVREPFHGYWQTSDYGYWASMNGQPVRRALGEMKLKFEIARPRAYETLQASLGSLRIDAAAAITAISAELEQGQSSIFDARLLHPVPFNNGDGT